MLGQYLRRKPWYSQEPRPCAITCPSSPSFLILTALPPHPCHSLVNIIPDGFSNNHNLEMYLHNIDPARDVALMNKASGGLRINCVNRKCSLPRRVYYSFPRDITVWLFSSILSFYCAYCLVYLYVSYNTDQQHQRHLLWEPLLWEPTGFCLGIIQP